MEAITSHRRVWAQSLECGEPRMNIKYSHKIRLHTKIPPPRRNQMLRNTAIKINNQSTDSLQMKLMLCSTLTKTFKKVFLDTHIIKKKK